MQQHRERLGKDSLHANKEKDPKEYKFLFLFYVKIAMGNYHYC